MFSHITLKTIAQWLGAEQASAPDVPIREISTDSRSLKGGELFVALRGDNFDGHQYISDAVEGGAVAVVAEKKVNASVPVFLVPDTLRALVRVAHAIRNEFSGPVLSVTGSSGKSSTKEMIATLCGAGTVRSPASFNNLLGVSKTLFLVNEHTQRLVLEMGMNAFGEIRELCETFQPCFGLITNIGDAHMGKLGGVEGVYQAKKEMFDFLAKPRGSVSGGAESVPNRRIGVALNMDDANVVRAYQEAGLSDCLTIRYGVGEPASDTELDVCVDEVLVDRLTACLNVRLLLGGKASEHVLPMFGVHHAQNLAAAIAAAKLLSIDDEKIRQGVSGIRPASHRGEIHRLPNERILIDESYNSNPSALKSALSSLVKMDESRRLVLVLGDMLELESFAEDQHRQVGEFAQDLFSTRSETPWLIGCGPLMGHFLKAAGAEGKVKTTHCQDSAAAIDSLREGVAQGDVILVKSSRGGRLDRVVDGLLKDALKDSLGDGLGDA